MEGNGYICAAQFNFSSFYSKDFYTMPLVDQVPCVLYLQLYLYITTALFRQLDSKFLG